MCRTAEKKQDLDYYDISVFVCLRLLCGFQLFLILFIIISLWSF